MNSEGANKKRSINFYYWVPFFVCIFSMTEFFGGYKYINEGETLKALIMIPGSILITFIALGFMAFQIYSEEKQRDNLKSEFYLFERIYSATHKEGQHG